MDIVACPDPTCPAPAWVYDRWTWASTNGPVEHVKTGCEGGHWFTPLAASLAVARRCSTCCMFGAQAGWS
jgi:hypothetical protein